MLTLSDINAQTNSCDGDLYSDLFKDHYGFRPRDVLFRTIEEFDEDLNWLSEQVSKQIEQEKIDQANAFENFKKQVADYLEILPLASKEDVVRLIALENGVTEEDIKFYKWGYAEYCLNIPYGSIEEFLGAN